jgi:hypothetical protein
MAIGPWSNGLDQSCCVWGNVTEKSESNERRERNEENINTTKERILLKEKRL